MKLKAGDDITLKFTVTDPDDTVVNLTGGTLIFKIAKNLVKTDLQAIYFGEYTTFTGAAQGEHIETIANADTQEWKPGTYQYQVRFIDSDDVVRSDDVDTVIIEKNLIDHV